MEESRKGQQTLTLYRQRLQNLPKIINQLHEIVKNDEIINTLKDSTMEKYRIDRVNELVADVLNSEKEKMLIRVLEKYQQQSAQLKEQEEKYEAIKISNNKQSSYYDNWLDLKQKNEKQMMKCRLLLDEKTEIIQKLNKEIKDLKQKSSEKQVMSPKKQTENCISCKKLTQDLSESQNELKIMKQVVEKLKRDGESAVQLLSDKIQGLTQTNQKLQSELAKKPAAIVKQSKQDVNFKNDNAKRNEKVEVMRRQIAYLQQQLIQVQKQFNLVKDIAIGGTAVEIKKLRSLHKKLKQSITQSLANLGKQNKDLMEKVVMKLLTEVSKGAQTLKADRLMSKLNHIDNELDYFIENQILVE